MSNRSTIQNELAKLEAALRQGNELADAQRKRIELLKAINETMSQGYTKSIEILVDVSALMSKISEFTEKVNAQNTNIAIYDEGIDRDINTRLGEIRNFLMSQKETLAKFGLPQLG